MSPARGRLDTLSHFTPFALSDGRDEGRVRRRGTTPSMLYGVLVAVGLTTLAVTVGTRAFRTAGA